MAPGPDGVAEQLFPLDNGFMSVFGVNHMTVSFFSLPGIFSTGFGFMFAYGRQLYSMSKSGLFPRFLSRTYGPYETPASALIIGSIMSYCILLILYYTVPDFGVKIFNICMLGSCSVYIALARAYMVCYDRYSNLERQFHSPFGKWAAYWVVAVFSLMIVCLAFFQDDDFLSISVFIAFVVIGWVYYHFVAQKREFFSEEEQKKFMKAYILNANHKKKHINRGSNSIAFISKIMPGFVSETFGGARGGKSLVHHTSRGGGTSFSRARATSQGSGGIVVGAVGSAHSLASRETLVPHATIADPSMRGAATAAKLPSSESDSDDEHPLIQVRTATRPDMS